MPDQLGVYPLTDTVLFPRTLLPLHVADAAGRALLEDAARGSGHVVLGIWRSGAAADSTAEPSLYPTACVGRIVELQEADDGGCDVILRGEAVVRIVEFVDGAPHLTARVHPLRKEGCFETSPGAARRCRELHRLLEDACPGCLQALRAGWAGDLDRGCGVELLHTVAMYLPVSVEKKVEWLASAGSLARWVKLRDTLREMGVARRRRGGVLRLYADLRPEDAAVN
jgi:Lon protease-like protein